MTETFNYNGLLSMMVAQMMSARSQIEQNMMSANKIASRRTMRNVRVLGEVTPFGARVTMTAPKYAFTATEQGRQPRINNQNCHLWEKIYKWSLDKGIAIVDKRKRKKKPFDAVKARERFAKFVAWKINKYGTREYRNGGNRRDIFTITFVNTEKNIQREVQMTDLYRIIGRIAQSEVESIRMTFI